MTRSRRSAGGRGRAAARRPGRHAGLSERARRCRPAPWCRCRWAGAGDRHRLARGAWASRAGAAQLRAGAGRPCPACRRWAAAWLQLVEFSAGLLPAQHRRGGAVGAAARTAQARRCADGATPRAAAAHGCGRVAAALPSRALPPLTDEQAAAAGVLAALAAWRHHADAAARRHRQRQDRGLPAQRGTCAGGRAARCWCWCPRSTSRRSSRRASPSALPATALVSLHSGADAGAAPAPLAAGAPGPGRPGAGHAAGGVCVDAAAGADRRRRGARPVVQAAGGRALFGARPGGLPRPRSKALPVLLGSATPSLESWQRAEQGRYRRLRLTAAHRRRRAARGAPARHERRAAPGQRRAAGAGAGAAAGHRTAHRARRAEPAVPQPARLCAGAVLRRLRLEERLPALQRLARVPQGRPHAALPPLRLHRARAARLPRLRQPGHRARSAAAPSGWKSSSPQLLPQRARGAHRRRQHARQGRAAGAT